MSTVSLAELADSAAPDDRNEVIERLLARLSSTERSVFLRGLMERLVATDMHKSDGAEHELMRWVGSWILSSVLGDDPTYVQSDAEVSAMLDRGDCGLVVSGSDLRARYADRR